MFSLGKAQSPFRGAAETDAASLSASKLMGLELQALRQSREPRSLAERPGSTAIHRRGQGHEIREIRPFAEGDDPRHLDAAATARSGSPHIRSFHEDRENIVMLIADFRRPMHWGSQKRLRSVAAAEVLMLSGWQASLARGAVGAVILTDNGALVQAPRPRHRGMAELAGLFERSHAAAVAAVKSQTQSSEPLDEMLMRAARNIPRGAGILLASGLDQPGPALDAALAALRARGPLRIFLIEDAFEREAPRQALPLAHPDGPLHGRFDALAAARDERAARLAFPGQDIRRILTSHSL